ncbi:MAG: alpha-E domain-containing protein [Betaproteobacteria bacterium]|nr:alpha-E domain-containing protein [Betaproteobacteria bacterium]
MLSRVASELYWMSRYLERAESMARILEVCSSIALLSTTGAAQDDLAVSEPLVITDTESAFAASGRALSMDQVAQFLAWDDAHPSSISNCIRACRENARYQLRSLSRTQVSLVPPPWEELTTSEPSRSATRVNPPGTMRISRPTSTKGRRSIWRGATPCSTKVGQAESAKVGWAM